MLDKQHSTLYHTVNPSDEALFEAFCAKLDSVEEKLLLAYELHTQDLKNTINKVVDKQIDS